MTERKRTFLVWLAPVVTILWGSNDSAFAQSVYVENPMKEKVQVWLLCLEHEKWVEFPLGDGSVAESIEIAAERDKTRDLPHAGTYRLVCRNSDGSDYVCGDFHFPSKVTTKFRVKREWLTVWEQEMIQGQPVMKSRKVPRCGLERRP